MTSTLQWTDAQRDQVRALLARHPGLRVLTVKQPFADLIMAGVKDVENRSWPVPSTLPQWSRCDECGTRSRPDAGIFGAALWCPKCRGHMSWDGPFPFTLGIHAAKTWDDEGPWAALSSERYGGFPISAVKRAVRGVHGTPPRIGVLLGTVTVTGCHHADECEYEHGDTAAYSYCSRWSEPDCWHWTLADPEPLDVPVPMRGMLGLWPLAKALP